MAQQPGNITRLEWITCPRCTQTFQIAVPAKAADMRVWPQDHEIDRFSDNYTFSVRCINPACRESIQIETDLFWRI